MTFLFIWKYSIIVPLQRSGRNTKLLLLVYGRPLFHHGLQKGRHIRGRWGAVSLGSKSKYNLLMRRRIAASFTEWEEKGEIAEKAIYSFLYKVRGVARSLGMRHIELLAADKIAQVTMDQDKKWKKPEWQSFLAPFYDILNEDKQMEDTKAEEAERELAAPQQVSGQANDVILLIEDDVDFIAMLKERLESEGYHIVIALTLQKGLSLFYSMNPAFVMLNTNLVDSDQNLEKFGNVVKQSITPLAIISEEGAFQNRAYAYELGATDFIQKEVLDPEWFLPYLRNRLSFTQSGFVDELTGAFNRRYMERSLSDLLTAYKRSGEVFSVGIIDIDHFKQINDTYGHIAGDRVLQRLVKLINEHKRKSDDLCRFGGEEFVLCLPRTTQEGAEHLMNRIREAFSREVFESDLGTFRVTFSAGIVTVDERNAIKEKLLDQADKALYKSKASGRNCVHVFCPDESPAVRKMHVIIVDDDRLVRAMLERNFSDWKPIKNVQVEVHTYKDGIEFLESDWYNPKDQYIILLDGIMPRMNGVEVLEKVRSLYHDKNIIISMLSARSEESTIIHALEKGADDYMLKPFKVQEVLARIGRLARRLLF